MAENSPRTQKGKVKGNFFARAGEILGSVASDYFSEATPTAFSILDQVKSAPKEIAELFTTTTQSLQTKFNQFTRLPMFRNINSWFYNKANAYDIEEEDLNFDGLTDEENEAPIEQQQISEAKQNTNQLSKVFVETIGQQVKASNVALAAQRDLIEKQTNVISSGFDTINSSIKNLTEIITKNTSTLIATNVAGSASGDGDGIDPRTELLTSRFDAGTYKDLIKQNMSNSDNMFVDAVRYVMDMTAEDMENAFSVENVAKTGFSFFMDTFFPNVTEELDNLDQILSDNIVSGLIKLGRRGGEDGAMGLIGQILGIDTTRENISTQKGDLRLSSIGWDTVSKSALVNAIPGYLRKILTQLGGDDVVFDYRNGTFRSEKSIKREFQKAMTYNATGNLDSSSKLVRDKFNTEDAAQNKANEMLYSMMMTKMASDMSEENGSGDIENIKNIEQAKEYVNSMVDGVLEVDDTVQGQLDEFAAGLLSLAQDTNARSAAMDQAATNEVMRQEHGREYVKNAQEMDINLHGWKDTVEGEQRTIARMFGYDRAEKSQTEGSNDIKAPKRRGVTEYMEFLSTQVGAYISEAVYRIWNRLNQGINVYSVGKGTLRDSPFQPDQSSLMPPGQVLHFKEATGEAKVSEKEITTGGGGQDKQQLDADIMNSKNEFLNDEGEDLTASQLADRGLDSFFNQLSGAIVSGKKGQLSSVLAKGAQDMGEVALKVGKNTFDSFNKSTGNIVGHIRHMMTGKGYEYTDDNGQTVRVEDNAKGGALGFIKDKLLEGLDKTKEGGKKILEGIRKTFDFGASYGDADEEDKRTDGEKKRAITGGALAGAGLGLLGGPIGMLAGSIAGAGIGASHKISKTLHEKLFGRDKESGKATGILSKLGDTIMDPIKYQIHKTTTYIADKIRTKIGDKIQDFGRALKDRIHSHIDTAVGRFFKKVNRILTAPFRGLGWLLKKAFTGIGKGLFNFGAKAGPGTAGFFARRIVGGVVNPIGGTLGFAAGIMRIGSFHKLNAGEKFPLLVGDTYYNPAEEKEYLSRNNIDPKKAKDLNKRKLFVHTLNRNLNSDLQGNFNIEEIKDTNTYADGQLGIWLVGTGKDDYIRPTANEYQKWINAQRKNRDQALRGDRKKFKQWQEDYHRERQKALAEGKRLNWKEYVSEREAAERKGEQEEERKAQNDQNVKSITDDVGEINDKIDKIAGAVNGIRNNDQKRVDEEAKEEITDTAEPTPEEKALERQEESDKAQQAAQAAAVLANDQMSPENSRSLQTLQENAAKKDPDPKVAEEEVKKVIRNESDRQREEERPEKNRKSLFEKMGDWFSNIGGLSGFGNLLGGGLTSLLPGILVGGLAISFLTKFLNDPSGTVTSTFNNIGAAIKNLFSFIKDGEGSPFNAITSLADMEVDNTVEYMPGVGTIDHVAKDGAGNDITNQAATKARDTFAKHTAIDLFTRNQITRNQIFKDNAAFAKQWGQGGVSFNDKFVEGALRTNPNMTTNEFGQMLADNGMAYEEIAEHSKVFANAKKQLDTNRYIDQSEINAYNKAHPEKNTGGGFNANAVLKQVGAVGVTAGVSSGAGFITGAIAKGFGADDETAGMWNRGAQVLTSGALTQNMARHMLKEGAQGLDNSVVGKLLNALERFVNFVKDKAVAKWPKMTEKLGKGFNGISKWIGKINDKTLKPFMTKINTKLAEAGIEGGLGAATGGILIAAGAVVGLISGIVSTEHLFGVLPGDCTPQMRAISAFLGSVMGAISAIPAISFIAAIIDVIDMIFTSLAGKGLTQMIAEAMMNATEEGAADLEAAQGRMQNEVQAYNERFGTSLDVNTYNDMVNNADLGQAMWEGNIKKNEDGSIYYDEAGGVVRTGIKNLFVGSEKMYAKDAQGNVIRDAEGNAVQAVDQYGNTLLKDENWGNQVGKWFHDRAIDAFGGDVYETDENGVALVDENGNPIKKGEKIGFWETVGRTLFGGDAYEMNEDGTVKVDEFGNRIKKEDTRKMNAFERIGAQISAGTKMAFGTDEEKKAIAEKLKEGTIFERTAEEDEQARKDFMSVMDPAYAAKEWGDNAATDETDTKDSTDQKTEGKKYGAGAVGKHALASIKTTGSISHQLIKEKLNVDDAGAAELEDDAVAKGAVKDENGDIIAETLPGVSLIDRVGKAVKSGISVGRQVAPMVTKGASAAKDENGDIVDETLPGVSLTDKLNKASKVSKAIKSGTPIDSRQVASVVTKGAFGPTIGASVSETMESAENGVSATQAPKKNENKRAASSTVETDKNGNTVRTETRADGSQLVTTTRPDGTSYKTYIDPSGEVQLEVDSENQKQGVGRWLSERAANIVNPIVANISQLERGMQEWETKDAPWKRKSPGEYMTERMQSFYDYLLDPVNNLIADTSAEMGKLNRLKITNSSNNSNVYLDENGALIGAETEEGMNKSTFIDPSGVERELPEGYTYINGKVYDTKGNEVNIKSMRVARQNSNADTSQHGALNDDGTIKGTKEIVGKSGDNKIITTKPEKASGKVPYNITTINEKSGQTTYEYYYDNGKVAHRKIVDSDGKVKLNTYYSKDGKTQSNKDPGGAENPLLTYMDLEMGGGNNTSASSGGYNSAIDKAQDLKREQIRDKNWQRIGDELTPWGAPDDIGKAIGAGNELAEFKSKLFDVGRTFLNEFSGGLFGSGVDNSGTYEIDVGAISGDAGSGDSGSGGSGGNLSSGGSDANLYSDPGGNYSDSPLSRGYIPAKVIMHDRINVSRITIHHMAGKMTSQSCGKWFQKNDSNSNYGIGYDGDISTYVHEADRSVCSSNSANDRRAITIEVSNSTNNDSRWPVTDASLNACIRLCADICKRYKKTRLVYLKTRAATDAYVQKSNEMLLTRHDFYTQKVCLPVDTTEVLTKHGWVKLDEVKLGEEVASVVDTRTMEIQFSPVRDIVEPYRADTYTLRDVEATGNHRMLVANQYGKDRNLWKIKSFSEIIEDHHTSDYFPQAGFYPGEGLGLSSDQIELLAAIQANGRCTADNQMEFNLSDDRKIIRMRYLLSSVGVEFRENWKADGSVYIRSCDKGLMEFAERYLDNNRFTWDLLNMDHNEAMVFLDSLVMWNGSVKNRTYFSTEKVNRDVVVAVASIHGRGALFNNSEDASGNAKISVRLGNPARSLSNSEAAVRKDVLVSCVTVDSGVILIRQNRMTTVVGNCPGPYLGDKFPYIVTQVNKMIGSGAPEPIITSIGSPAPKIKPVITTFDTRRPLGTPDGTAAAQSPSIGAPISVPPAPAGAPDDIAKALGAASPLSSATMSSGFGERPEVGDYHKGIDLVPNGDDRVRSTVEGRVVSVKKGVSDTDTGLDYHGKNASGNEVIVQGNDGLLYRQSHMKNASIPSTVQPGSTVRKGDKLGEVGNTGRSSGKHLHYEVAALDNTGSPVSINPLAKVNSTTPKKNIGSPTNLARSMGGPASFIKKLPVKKARKGIGAAETMGPPSPDFNTYIQVCQSVKEQYSKHTYGDYLISVSYGGKTIQRRADCSGYASAVVTLFSGQDCNLTSGGFVTANASQYGFTKSSFPGWNSLWEGDIVACDGHVEIYYGNVDGDHKSWSVGGNGIKTPGPGSSNDTNGDYKWSSGAIWRPNCSNGQRIDVSGISGSNGDGYTSGYDSSGEDGGSTGPVADFLSKLKKVGSTFLNEISGGLFGDDGSGDAGSSDGSMDGSSGGSGYYSDDTNPTNTGDFPKYQLTDSEITGVANIVGHEQGDRPGKYAEASLIANRTDPDGPSKGSGDIKKTLTSGWFADGASRMKGSSHADADAKAAVRDVIIGGKRTLPRYVDEHDCWSDIRSVTGGGGKNDKAGMKPHTTKIHNNMESIYTFYTFPGGVSSGNDPFGYTNTQYRQKFGDDHYAVGGPEDLLDAIGAPTDLLKDAGAPDDQYVTGSPSELTNKVGAPDDLGSKGFHTNDADFGKGAPEEMGPSKLFLKELGDMDGAEGIGCPPGIEYSGGPDEIEASIGSPASVRSKGGPEALDTTLGIGGSSWYETHGNGSTYYRKPLGARTADPKKTLTGTMSGTSKASSLNKSASYMTSRKLSNEQSELNYEMSSSIPDALFSTNTTTTDAASQWVNMFGRSEERSRETDVQIASAVEVLNKAVDILSDIRSNTSTSSQYLGSINQRGINDTTTNNLGRTSTPPVYKDHRSRRTPYHDTSESIASIEAMTLP